MHDIPILDDIGLAFQAINAVRLRLLHRADAAEIVKANDLGPDKAARQVRMDLARTFPGGGAAVDGPGATFVFADREKHDAAHGAINLLNTLVACKTAQAQVAHEGLT